MKYQDSELLLWNKMSKGDSAAFKNLYIKYAPELFTYGSHFTSDRELVKDCVQEVFTKIHYNSKNLNTPKNVKFYLLLAMKNQLYMEFRRKKFSSDIGMDSLSFTPVYTEAETMYDEEKEEIRKIHDLLNKLPIRQKEIIYYRYIEELSMDEICNMMNLKYQSAQNLIQRALLKMRNLIEISIILLFFYFFKKLQ